MKKFLILLTIIFFVTACGKTGVQVSATPYQTQENIQTLNYDFIFIRFWNEFYNTILNNNTKKLKALTKFPLETRGPLDFNPIIKFNTDKFDEVFLLFLNGQSGYNYNKTQLDYIKNCRVLNIKNSMKLDYNRIRVGDMVLEFQNNSWKLAFIYLDQNSCKELGIGN